MLEEKNFLQNSDNFEQIEKGILREDKTKWGVRGMVKI